MQYAAQYIANSLVYGTDYQAKILVANLDVLNTSDPVWIGAGLQIDEDVYPNDPDEFLIWKPSGESWVLNSINDAEIAEATNPIFAITNGIELPADAYVLGAPTVQKETGGTFPEWTQTSAQILNRYEASGSSEYTMSVLDFSEGFVQSWSSEWAWAASQIPGTRTTSVEWDIFVDPSSLATAINADVFTYEYDGGFTSAKDGLWAWFGSERRAARCRRKFNNEWYHFDPFSTTGNPDGYDWYGYHPNHNSARTQNQGKGALIITRHNF